MMRVLHFCQIPLVTGHDKVQGGACDLHYGGLCGLVVQEQWNQTFHIKENKSCEAESLGASSTQIQVKMHMSEGKEDQKADKSVTGGSPQWGASPWGQVSLTDGGAVIWAWIGAKDSFGGTSPLDSTKRMGIYAVNLHIWFNFDKKKRMSDVDSENIGTDCSS